MSLSVLLVGGSGFWSEQNHIKNLLMISDEVDFSVDAIIDPVDPAEITQYPNLRKLLDIHQPLWINPTIFSSVEEVFSRLLIKPDLVIISSNPETHYEYAVYCAKNKIRTLVDKPVIMTRNAASSVLAAQNIVTLFDKLAVGNTQPSATLYTLLRRRSLPAFVKLRDELYASYRETKAPLTHLTIQVNGGIHKFPIEFESDYGAHGYQAGVGSLSHSAYHYIDVMSWLLCSALGPTQYLHVKMNYVKRVSDYVGSKGYAYIQELLGLQNQDIDVDAPLSQELLAAELDVGFSIELRDEFSNMVGVMTFNFNHTGFSPRLRGVERTNHSNFDDGGRMSQVYLDVHQSTVRHWQVIKNDVVFNGDTIAVNARQHPKTGNNSESEVYTDAYNSVELPMDRGLLHLLSSSSQEDSDSIKALGIKHLNSEKINTYILSAFYELIARDYEADKNNEIILDMKKLLIDEIDGIS